MKNPGRPTKKPPATTLGAYSLFVDDVRQILKQCKAPPTWGDREVVTILQFFRMPFTFDMFGLEKLKEEDPKLYEIQAQDTLEKALRFSHMFATAQHCMITAMTMIRRRIAKCFKNPRRAVVFNYLMDAEHKSFGSVRCARQVERFWTEKANILSAELSEALGITITAKTVEHARREVRAFLEFPPQTRQN